MKQNELIAMVTITNQRDALLKACKRLLNAFETDGRISPRMPIKISLETNGGALREAREAIAEAELDQVLYDAAKVFGVPIVEKAGDK